MTDRNTSTGLLIGLILIVLGTAYGIQRSFGVSYPLVIVPALLVIGALYLLLGRNGGTPPPANPR